jgi:hypothetical protein
VPLYPTAPPHAAAFAYRCRLLLLLLLVLRYLCLSLPAPTTCTQQPAHNSSHIIACLLHLRQMCFVADQGQDPRVAKPLIVSCFSRTTSRQASMCKCAACLLLLLLLAYSLCHTDAASYTSHILPNSWVHCIDVLVPIP